MLSSSRAGLLAGGATGAETSACMLAGIEVSQLDPRFCIQVDARFPYRSTAFYIIPRGPDLESSAPLALRLRLGIHLGKPSPTKVDGYGSVLSRGARMWDQPGSHAVSGK